MLSLHQLSKDPEAISSQLFPFLLLMFLPEVQCQICKMTSREIHNTFQKSLFPQTPLHRTACADGAVPAHNRGSGNAVR